MTSSVSSLDQAILFSKALLQTFAEDPDFWDIFQESFGNHFNSSMADVLKQSWKLGDFTQLPSITIESSDILGGANGAYSATTNQIYLSQQYLDINGNNPKAIASVLLEEIGHFIDSVINTSDSPGDEGAIFSALVGQQSLGQEQLQELRLENDSTVIVIGGQTIQVERSGSYTGNNLQSA